MTTLETKTDRAQVKARLPRLTALIEENPSTYSNVARGELGQVLYYFYLFRIFNDMQFAVKGKDLLNNILRMVTGAKEHQLMNPTLANGLAGLGLVLEVLINEGFIDDAYDAFLCRLDTYIYEASLKKLKNGDTDFLHGATGGFHYLTYRLDKNPDVKAYLSDYVECLFQITVKRDNGSCLPNTFFKNVSVPGEVNLGLSHGMAASVLVLINIFEQDIQTSLITYLLNQYILFYLELRSRHPDPEGVRSQFPNSVFLNEERSSSRNEDEYRGGLRWCYGDMNVTHMLYKASKALGNRNWWQIANETGLATLSNKDIVTARCHGSFFCHGATGIAHYYDYLYRISGEAGYQRGFQHWINIAFDIFEKEDKEHPYLEYSGFLLEGSVGSGLVLMASQELEPAYWEKIWLLS